MSLPDYRPTDRERAIVALAHCKGADSRTIALALQSARYDERRKIAAWLEAKAEMGWPDVEESFPDIAEAVAEGRYLSEAEKADRETLVWGGPKQEAPA